jgi:hypothetical protein
MNRSDRDLTTCSSTPVLEFVGKSFVAITQFEDNEKSCTRMRRICQVIDGVDQSRPRRSKTPRDCFSLFVYQNSGAEMVQLPTCLLGSRSALVGNFGSLFQSQFHENRTAFSEISGVNEPSGRTADIIHFLKNRNTLLLRITGLAKRQRRLALAPLIAIESDGENESTRDGESDTLRAWQITIRFESITTAL